MVFLTFWLVMVIVGKILFAGLGKLRDAGVGAPAPQQVRAAAAVAGIMVAVGMMGFAATSAGSGVAAAAPCPGGGPATCGPTGPELTFTPLPAQTGAPGGQQGGQQGGQDNNGIATSPAGSGGDNGPGIQAQTPQFGTPGQQAPNIPGNEQPGQGSGQQPQGNGQGQQNQNPTVQTTAPGGPRQSDGQQPEQSPSGQPSSPTVTVTKTESQCAVPGAANGAGATGGPGGGDASNNGGGTGPDNGGDGENKDGAPSWAYLVGEVSALMTGRRGRKAGPLNPDGSAPTNDMIPNDQVDGENYKEWTTPDGKRTFILSENADAPSQYRFNINEVDRPDGGSVDVNDDGTLSTYDRDGNEVDRFTPWAYDTKTGEKIPTSYTRSGDDLIQTINRPEGNNNPILADPPGDGAAAGAGAGAQVGSVGNAPPTEQQAAQTAGSMLPAISGVVPQAPDPGSPAVSVEVSPQVAQNPLVQAVQGTVPTQVKTPAPGTPQDNGLSSVSVGDPSGQVDTTVVSDDGNASRSQSTRDGAGNVDTVTQTFDGSRIDGHTQVDSNGNPVTSSWTDTPGNRGTVDNTSPEQRTHVDVADQYGGGYTETITTGENGNVYRTTGVNANGDVIETTITNMGQQGLAKHYRINGVDEEVLAASRINELGDPARLKIFNEKVKPAQEAYERAVRDLYTSSGDRVTITAAQGQVKRTYAALLEALGEYGLVPKFDPSQITQTGNGTYQAPMTGPDGKPILGGNGKPLMAKIFARPDGGFSVEQATNTGIDISRISATNGYEGTQHLSNGAVEDKSLDTFLGILDVVGVAAAAPGAGRALGGLLRVGGEQIASKTLKEGGEKAAVAALRTTTDEASGIAARQALTSADRQAILDYTGNKHYQAGARTNAAPQRSSGRRPA
ncbi:hypothetical protein AXK60_08365 [Tsukamurella pseudospumae]|uniref:Uncharacterized protein n=1 Tax=Tsukamurella pseudospumae TaxID=239498 RepID=A0A138AJA3_9ACTN|nr:hypothetical protein AXK60_08365 [Tsukamurella pseudospumae]